MYRRGTKDITFTMCFFSDALTKPILHNLVLNLGKNRSIAQSTSLRNQVFPLSLGVLVYFHVFLRKLSRCICENPNRSPVSETHPPHPVLSGINNCLTVTVTDITLFTVWCLIWTSFTEPLDLCHLIGADVYGFLINWPVCIHYSRSQNVAWVGVRLLDEMFYVLVQCFIPLTPQLFVIDCNYFFK